MLVLGLNGIDNLFHDASASIISDGNIVASVEEERFNRRKHSSGLPWNAIDFCLRKAGAAMQDVDLIGYYLDPNVLERTFVDDVVKNHGADAARLAYYRKAAADIRRIPQLLASRYGPLSKKTRFEYVNHHLAHAASSYYVSGFTSGAILTIDGAGDRETCTLYAGEGATLNKVHDFLVYPQSLGFMYTVFAHHLGLDWISGPGKLMGLAGYGTPDARALDGVVKLLPNPATPVELDLSFFDYHLGGSGFTQKGVARFGRPRDASEPLTEAHADLAASVQLALEEAILHIVNQIPRHLPGAKRLCMAGGVALNVCTNRRIADLPLFEKLFVTPPAYDGGTSLGCALYLHSRETKQHGYAFQPYLGPDIVRDFNVQAALEAASGKVGFQQLTEPNLVAAAARILAGNGIIGWMQGRMECGPRALGNRSILANPANPRAKDELNARVKKREAFRPYAPSVLREEAWNWFDLDESPFMLLEAKVRPTVAARVPGIVHVDGTSRPQTVERAANPRYHALLTEFFRLTGIPLVLNTSFNVHGEPVVNTPDEAIHDFLSTDMDALFIGDFMVTKTPRRA